MGQEPSISLKDVSKCFKRYDRPVNRLKEVLLPSKNYADNFWALQDINLEIYKGQTVGIVGRNGSGKSTLLQIIAGTLTATTGSIQVNGRVSALLELGSGFNPEFTGQQNVFFNASLLGLSQQEIERKFDEIAAFADIGDFINLPVKTYSSGMFVRLAFAVAVNVNPEILIIDEALAVGDIYFQQKCFDKLSSLREKGTTLLFVSHDMTAVCRLCDRAVLMESGKVSLWAEARKVIDLYEINLIKMLNQQSNNLQVDRSAQLTNRTHHQNGDLDATELQGTTNQTLVTDSDSISLESGQAKLMFAKILDVNDREIQLVTSEQFIKLCIGISFLQAFDDPLIGFQLRDRTGLVIFQTNTFMMGKTIGYVSENALVEVCFEFAVPLSEGEYTITLGVANQGVGLWSYKEALLRLYNIYVLKVAKNHSTPIWFGIVNLAPTASIRIL